MTVREATQADVPRLLEMGRRFIESSRVYSEHLSVVPSRQAEVIDALLLQGGCWVLCPADALPVGMLGMLLTPLPLTGELAALEVMWWVEPEHRAGAFARHLWTHAEDWAAAQGAAVIQMLQPVDEVALGGLYRRRGYAPVEVSWFKRLGSVAPDDEED